jgi:SAM-dependent methyltransferase
VSSFAAFDRRGYRTVDARTGYAAWAPTYEGTVEDAMDVELLDLLTELRPAGATVADLGCGSGRTGAWLRDRGAGPIDGVDVTPEMLELAARRGVFRALLQADATATGLDAGAYDLVTTSLVDEHLSDLRPLYAEAARLLVPGGTYVLVGFHPHFIMASGMPTHFDDATGEPVAIITHVHQLSDQVAAAHAAGFRLAELRERVVDDGWVALKPKWEALRGHPVTFAAVWRREQA